MIDLFFERSEQAINELQSKYGKLCRKAAFQMLNSREDCEECINEAMLAVWNTIPPAKPESLKGYLLKLLRNQVLKRVRYNNAAKRGGYDTALDELAEAVPAADDVESEYDSKLAAKAVNSFLTGLDSYDRALFIKRYWFGKTIEELSEEFGISKHYVSVRLHRIREKLKKHLEKEGVYL